MTQHKHYKEIIAWAEGHEIQSRCNAIGLWVDNPRPGFAHNVEYRIKPKTVKREGWVNIYRMHDGNSIECGCVVHETEQEALSCAGMQAIATAKIEWEEEE